MGDSLSASCAHTVTCRGTFTHLPKSHLWERVIMHKSTLCHLIRCAVDRSGDSTFKEEIQFSMNWLKIRKYNLESYFSFVWPTINGHTCQFTSICSSGSAVSFPLCYSLMILADRGVGVMFSGKSSAKPFLRFSLIGIFGNLSSWWSSCIQSSPTDNVRLDPKKVFYDCKSPTVTVLISG